MYFPVMRGKQNELLALQELASFVSHQNFKPIIEPVRNNFRPLLKTIKALNQYNIIPLVIINPCMGDFEDKDSNLINALENNSLKLDINFIPCVKIKTSAEDYKNIFDSIDFKKFSEKAVYIYDDIDRDKTNLLAQINYLIIKRSTPIEIIEQLKNFNIVLMDDPFKKRKKNADYGDNSFFSDLHISFKKFYSNVIGFGDYTIVGDNYSENGGPAYVVTIHLSYIDEKNDFMYVMHFSSEYDKTPTNPGGKFIQALEKFVQLSNSDKNPFIKTNGMQTLESLYIDKHYPGLGVIKKISMMHHIETICEYLDR